MSRPQRPAPVRRYGQHHLVDGGTLAAILKLAAPMPNDVVLEVGAGDGLLTRPLVERAAAVHVFEIDARFAPVLGGLAAAYPGLQVHLGDALKADLGALRPLPTALIANLAYNISIPLIMRSLVQLPSLERWAVMVQAELAQRLFARPRTKAYSAVSVLVQLQCELVAQRSVPRTVFSPQPRVDSAFVVFRRRHEAPPSGHWDALDRLVRLAFGQRRKMLASSLGGAAGASGTLTRGAVQAALQSLRLPPTARPEELTPSHWISLAKELGWT